MWRTIWLSLCVGCIAAQTPPVLRGLPPIPGLTVLGNAANVTAVPVPLTAQSLNFILGGSPGANNSFGVVMCDGISILCPNGVLSVGILNQNTTGTANNVTGIVGILNGGTGLPNPSLIAGTNVTITGAWPNQTINSSGGGGGSMTWPAAPGVVVYAGSSAWGTSLTAPAGTIVGTTDNQALTNKTLDGVSPATMAFVDPSSSIQTQLNGKQASGAYLTGNQTITLSGDTTGSGATAITTTTAAVNGTTVPVNSAADQTIVTTGSAVGAWKALPGCLDSGGNHLNYNTSTHVFSCGTTASGGGSTTFSSITGSTNTTAAMVVGAGASLAPTSATAGVLSANQINGTALSGLATGIIKNTTTTGIPSIAIAADFPTLNQSTTGNALTATTATNIAGGLLGAIHYQSAVDTTALLAGNTAADDRVLISHGTGSVSAIPSFTAAPTISAANMTSFPASLMTTSTVLASGQMPAFTGDVTNSGLAMTVGKIGGKTVTLSGNFTTTGAFNPTFAVPSSSTWTLPAGPSTLMSTATVVASGQMPTFTGDVTNSGLAMTVGAIGGKTVSLSGNLTTTGAFNPTFAIPSSSTWTFPAGPSTLMSTATNVAAGQMPAFTGDCTNSAGAVALTCTAINGKTVSLSGNLTTTGAFNPTFSIPASTTWTFPAGPSTLMSTATVLASGQMPTLTGDVSNSGLATTVGSIGGKTVTLSGNLTTTGSFNPTFAIPSSSTWTFPAGPSTLMSTDTSVLAAQMPALTGDVTTSAGAVATTAVKINGTSVPTNAAGDQVILTTASATGSWGAVPACLDSAGNHLNYSTVSHAFSCGTSSSGGSTTFSSLTGSTNTTAAMVVGSGATLAPTSASAGVISANQINGTALGGLATGILKNTTTTGVPSIAVAGDFPTLNQNSTGTSNLAGGALGSLPYQSAAATTAVIAGNTAATDQVLISHGTGSVSAIPTLSNAPTLSAANMTSFPASLMTTSTVLGSSQMPTFTGDVTNSGLAMTVGKIGGKTVSLSGNFTTTGAFNPTFSIPSSSTWTFPAGPSTLMSTATVLGSSQMPVFTGDVTNSGLAMTAVEINGTTVPTNAAADQVILTTASATGSWAAVTPCLDSAGNHLNYNSTTHAFLCGSTSSSGTPTFSAITGSTNTTATMVVGSGASIAAAGAATGTVDANSINGTNLSFLATGILRNATSTGVVTIATAGQFPTLNQSTTGNATTATRATNIAGGLLGTLPYQSAVNTTALLAGNTTSAKQYLTQTGTGTVSAIPAWGAIAAADVPAALSSTTSVNGTTIPSSSTLTQTIASGTSTMGTTLIATTACATVVTTSATGTLSTDAFTWSNNLDVSGVTGYTPATAGSLRIYAYPTTDNVNFKVCNPTTSSITPGAITLNWRVTR